MPLPQLPAHPIKTGQFMDAFYGPVYDTAWQAILPCPGLSLVPSFLGDIPAATVDAVVAARQAYFDLDQKHGSFHPVLLHFVGFVVDAQGVTVYEQYQPPNYSPPITELTYVAPEDGFEAFYPLTPYPPIGPVPPYPRSVPKVAGSPDFPDTSGTSPRPGFGPFR
jgi:hypothetical protein